MAQSELPRVGGFEGMEESLDVSQRAEVPKLRKGAVGLGGVLFLTVTGSAPISAMLFNTPIMVGYGRASARPPRSSSPRSSWSYSPSATWP